MKHIYSIRRQYFLLLVCALWGASLLKAEVPFVNSMITHHSESVRIFNTADDIPFLSEMLQARQNEALATTVEMMDCFDVFTVGGDVTANYGDTITLVGTARNTNGAATKGIWYLSDGASGYDTQGLFLNTDGSVATTPPFGAQGTFTSNLSDPLTGVDTIRFVRGAMDDSLKTNYTIVFAAINSPTNCSQLDSSMITIDLAPNLELDLISNTDTTILQAGASSNNASLVYCSDQNIALETSVTRNPTLSGQPVFILAEVTDTSNQLGLASFNGGTPLNGDTLYLTPNQLDFTASLSNNGDEDIFVGLRLFPYYESDGTSTIPGTSIYTPGEDIIGDSIELDIIIYSEPIVSFGGNDTICYAADAVLDFTGTPNTRVYYRDTFTNVIDSVDLNAVGRSEVRFTNITTNLYFEVDSIHRLNPPYCAASATSVAGISPQPFFVRDSLVASLLGVDTISCDTSELISFQFIGNVATDVYSFRLTNDKDATFDTVYTTVSNATLAFPLDSLDFNGVAGPDTLTFYLSELVDTSSSSNCENKTILDSLKVFIDPVPAISLEVLGTTLLSNGGLQSLDTTICNATVVQLAVTQLTTAASQNPMNVLVKDSLFNLSNGVRVFDTETLDTVPVSDLSSVNNLIASFSGSTDSLYLRRTLLPYFEMDSLSTGLDITKECVGDTLSIGLLLTPAPLVPAITFTADTLCGGLQDVLNITGGTPGSTVGYQFTGTNISQGIQTATLDAMGNFSTMSPAIDSGQVIASLQFAYLECSLPIAGADTLFIKPSPTGFLTIVQDSICAADTAYVIFNSNTTFKNEFDINASVLNIHNGASVSNVLGTYADGDTIFEGPYSLDVEFVLNTVSYTGGSSCINNIGDRDTLWVDTIPTMMVMVRETGVSPGPMTPSATAPDSIFLELCAGDSLYIDYDSLAVGSNSQFGDSLFVALFINDPLGVTAAGVGSSVVYRDINDMGGFDALHLVNNTNDTARIELIAIPYFTGVDASGMPTTTFDEACKGDSIEIQIDVINNVVSTIGGDYILCTGMDTAVVITGPDLAEIDYVAITANATGGLDTSAIRTITLDTEGRYEIQIDSILQDTTYDLIEARLPGSGCRANLGPNVSLTVIPPSIALFDSTSLMVCEGTGFITTIKGPINGSARISNNRNSQIATVTFGADSIATFSYDLLDSTTVFYVDSIYNDTSGLNPTCLTDTITDSLTVIQLDAKELTLVADTICAGDTAYVTVFTNSLDSFDITVNYDGLDTMLLAVVNGDTVAQLNGLVTDSTLVRLVSARARTAEMCQVLPLIGDVDTIAVRVDELPSTTIEVTAPVSMSIDAVSGPDTLVVCYNELLSMGASVLPAQSIAGFDAALVVSIDSNNVNTLSSTSMTIADFGTTMRSFVQTADSTIFDYTVQAYYPSDTLPNGDPMPYNSMVDCLGDSVQFTLIVVPSPVAEINFGMDTICENTTTSVEITGSIGDTILFAVEGFGTFNYVLTSPTASYDMPTVAQIDSAVLASTGQANDDEILFAIVSVNSGTQPSCTNATLDVDTLTIERLQVVELDVTALDTTICTGSDLSLSFSGASRTQFLVDFDYTNNDLDTMRWLTIGAASTFDTTIVNFRDAALVLTIDSVRSASARGCINDMNFVSPTIRSIALPSGILVADTVCNAASLPVVFRYDGADASFANNTFTVEYAQGAGTPVSMAGVSDGDTLTTLTGPGVHDLYLVSVRDDSTTCDTSYSNTQYGLPFTFVIEDRPQFAIEFTGGVSNGIVFDTDVPRSFPNPGVTFVCSGTTLRTALVDVDTTQAGDSTMAKVVVSRDDIGLFSNMGSSSLPYTIYTEVSNLEFNRPLINTTSDVEGVTFSWTAFNVVGQDTCYGGDQNFSINVGPTPIAEFSNTDTIRVCSADTVFLKFMGTTGANINFSDDNGNTYNSSVSTNDSVQYVVTQSGPDTVKFGIDLITYTNSRVNIPCTSTAADSVVLIIFERPEPFLTFASNDTVCYGTAVDVIFNDTVGLGPWNLVVNGSTYSNVDNGDILYRTQALTASTGFTISSARDANGCTADTTALDVVFTDTVRVDQVPVLVSEIETFGFSPSAISSDSLIDGTLDLGAICAQQRYTVNSGSSTLTNLAGDPLYVSIAITGDVSSFYPAYTGDTTLFVPVSMISSVLNTGFLANNTNATVGISVVLTPYFETNIASPLLDGAECGGAPDSFVIAVDPLPVPTTNAYNFAICSGDMLDFRFDTTAVINNYQLGTTFEYAITTSPNGLTRPLDGNTMTSIAHVLENMSATTATFTYIITPYGPGGCRGADFTIEVSVDPEPVLNSSSSFICSGEESAIQVIYSATSIAPDQYIVTGLTYDQDSLTAIDTVVVGSTLSLGNSSGDGLYIRDTYDNVSNGSQTVTYSLVPQVSATSCTGDTVEYTITVNPKPLVFNRDTTVCTDVALNLDLQAYVGNDVASSFTWVAISGDTSLIDGETRAIENTAYITDSLRLRSAAGTQQRQITYLVTATGTNGCGLTPETFFVRVNVSPNIQLSTMTPNGDYLCSGDPDGIQISAIASNTLGNVNYSWSISGVDPTVSAPVIIDPTGNSSTINVNATGNGQFVVNLEVSDDGGCTAMSSTTITVYDEIVANFDTTYIGAAPSATVDFTDISEGFPTQWLWTFGDSASGSADTSTVQNPTHTFTAPGTYTVTLRAVRQAFCPDTAVVTKQVFIGFIPVSKCDTIVLTPGFNTISLDVDTTDRSILAVFDDIIRNVDPVNGFSNLNQIIGVHPDMGSNVLVYNQFLQNFSEIRPGFGYIVDVNVQDTLVVCGTRIDTSLRVNLQSGINIVGYLADAPRAFNSYFDTLVSDNTLIKARTYENNVVSEWNPFFSNIPEVNNGFAYILDLNANYNGAEWRSNDFVPTSNFEYLFGSTNLGLEGAYQTIDVVDAEGVLRARLELDENGDFGISPLYGRVNNGRATIDGIEIGTELWFVYNGLYATTSHVFTANWKGTKLDLSFDLTSDVEDVDIVSEMSLYPNPASTYVVVGVSVENAASSRLQVVNVNGQLMIDRSIDLRAGLNQLNVDIQDLPAGYYSLKLVADNQVIGIKPFAVQ